MNAKLYHIIHIYAIILTAFMIDKILSRAQNWKVNHFIMIEIQIEEKQPNRLGYHQYKMLKNTTSQKYFGECKTNRLY